MRAWKARSEEELLAADRAVRFIRHLKHPKGRLWKGVNFELLDWQAEEIVKPLFGTLGSDGMRRFRTAYIEVGKKQGKSTLAAAIALKLLFADDEPMGEIYGAAVDKDQAANVFDIAAAMVDSSPILRRRCEIIRKQRRIVVTKGRSRGSIYRTIPADADGADGFNPSGVIFDEIHRQPSRELWDVLTDSTSTRAQPLVFGITTAGYDRESFCWSLHEYARQVIEGVFDDPTFLPIIHAADPEDNFRDPKAWQKACPSIGVTIPIEFFEQRAKRASEDPGYENNFCRFYLNQWKAQESRWMPMDRWDAAAGHLENEGLLEEVRKVPCWAGLDLSQTRDLTALAIIGAPAQEGGPFRVVLRCWIPADNVELASRRDGVRYDRWIEEGWLQTTPGDSIDYDTIERSIRADAMRFPIQQIAYDPTYAWQMAQQLKRAGLDMWPIRQGYESMAGPTADLLQLVKERRFEHGGNPVLRWMVDNTVVEQDSIGRWRPSKHKAKKRIDGVVATIMGLDRAERALFGERDDDGDEVLVYSDEVQISPRI